MTVRDDPDSRPGSPRLRTTPDEPDIARLRRVRALRRAFIVVLVVFLLLGVLGVFGVRTGKARADGGGYQLEVTYPTVTRAGLAAPWSVTVHRPGGLPSSVTVATTSDYLDLFEESTPQPEPQSSTADGERVLWEFEVPEGNDTLEISVSGRVGPNIKWRVDAVTAVLEQDQPAVEVGYHTRVLP